MRKKKKQVAEFRYYQMPENRAMFALLGEKWRQKYEREIDYLHFHNYLEIGYCYEGTGIMTLGEREYEYKGGEFTVIPANYLHTTNSSPGDRLSSWEYLFVDIDLLLDRSSAGAVRAGQLKRKINSRAIFSENTSYPRIAGFIREIMNVMRDEKKYCQEEAEGLMIALLAEVARINGAYMPKTEESAKGGVNGGQLIFRILDYISEHYDEPLKVSDIAAWAHISETHFRRIFSSNMKMSPLEYINSVRIRAACEFLRKTDDPVAIIAAKSGFSVISTFNRNFRRVTGVSPEEWRKRPENYEQQILKFRVHPEKGW